MAGFTFEFAGRSLVLRELSATAADAQQLLDLTNRVAAEGLLGIDSLAACVEEALLFISRSLEHGSILLGLFDGERLIGHLGIDRIAGSESGSSAVDWVAGTPARNTGTLVLFLDKAYRGAGLGYKLLASGCRLAKERGLRRIWAATRSDNQAAIRLYRKLGFRPRLVTPPTSDPLSPPGSPATIYLELEL
ncbi:MAG: GNAT family N-acetyltransferase [Limnochordales bacterium]|nr:GNAT family N-acetyltransferase [Limnochordales bacterium]